MHRSDTVSHQTSHQLQRSQSSCLILLSVVVAALDLSHDRLVMPAQAPHPFLKGKEQSFLEAVWQRDIFAFKFLNLFSSEDSYGLGHNNYRHLHR